MDTTRIIDVTADTYDREVLEHPGSVVVDFWGSTCAPCKQIAPRFDQLAQDFTSVKYVKVQLDTNKELALRLGIRALPTFIVYRAGEERSRHVGAPAFQHLIGAASFEHEFQHARLAVETARETVPAPPTQLQRLMELLTEFKVLSNAVQDGEGSELPTLTFEERETMVIENYDTWGGHYHTFVNGDVDGVEKRGPEFEAAKAKWMDEFNVPKYALTCGFDGYDSELVHAHLGAAVTFNFDHKGKFVDLHIRG